MGYDHIPASFIKPVSEFLVSPITFIINNFIKIKSIPRHFKTRLNQSNSENATTSGTYFTNIFKDL